ncbi:MAG: hypothetical protein ACM3SR_08095 [Ignavibacteriales bacterium]
MLNNRDGTNEKPRERVATQSQGKPSSCNSNNTTLRESKSRHDKGMELYKSGRVSIGANGLFKVSGYYECDTEKMSCTCPDYRTRKESCKHLFAAMLFVKNRGKESIENLEGHSNGAPSEQPSNKPTDTPNSATEARSKDFDKQAVITRLATINSAIEALKTHSKPIKFNDIVSLAAQLEQWALGQ